MGKVISLINTSPDGFADAQHAIIDPDYFEFVHTLLSRTGTIVFGRNTFEMFQDIWPARLDPGNAADWQMKMARSLNDMPKEVYSSTLNRTVWDNSTIIHTIDPGYIRSYKEKRKKGLLTLGSPGLVAALTKMNLIDDYYFCIQPVIAGHGNIRLFDAVMLEAPLPLQFVESIPLGSGVQVMHYTRLTNL